MFPPNIWGRGRTAADTREEVIAAENMAAKSVPMNIHNTGCTYKTGLYLNSYLHTRILGGYIRILTLHICVSRKNVRILGCTAADTREEVIAAENMAAKSVPIKSVYVYQGGIYV
jgi:hypothetical protein